MLNESLWRAHTYPALPAGPLPAEVDVAIIGGGITGLTAAYLLKRTGRRVAVFERERVGSGETGNTSAHLTFATDLRLPDMAKCFGHDAARLVWSGQQAAINLIEAVARAEHIDCGFGRVPGFTCNPFFTDDDRSSVLQEEAELAASMGFAARYLEHGPLTGKPAVQYADQAVFHPLDYIHGLALAVNRDGSFVFEKAEVGQVIQDPLAVTVNGQTIACGAVFIATHVPIAGSTPMIEATLHQTKLYPYSSYVLGGRLMKNSVAPGLYSDEDDPYYYLRVHKESDGSNYAIFGGRDHKTGTEGDTESRFLEVAKAFHTLCPDVAIERRWTGQVIETPDELPYAGETAPKQFVATGYTGNGLTFGTLSAMIVSDLIGGRSNPLASLLSPDRKASSASAITEYLRENVDYPLHFIADRLAPRNAGDDVESIAAGEGRVVTLNGQRVAASRSATGELTKVSAVCTHMACLVRWNNADRTWDCPCHGSRFTPDGLVIGGPAEIPLSPVD